MIYKQNILSLLCVLLLLLVVSGNLHAAAVNNIQTGSETMTGTTLNVQLCDSIEVDKTILLFTVTTNSNNISRNLVTGEILDEANITFRRELAGAIMSISWQLIEYSSGVTVQRGSTLVGATTTDQAITAVADLTKSFPIISMFNNGGTYGTDDGVIAELTSTTNLQFRCVATDFTVYWQVVEYDSCDVQTFSINLNDGSTSATGSLTAVNTSKTMIIGSHTQDGSVNADDLARIELTNSTTVTATRVGSSRGIEHFGYAIEFTDNTTVQHGLFGFTIGGTTDTETITAVQEDRSIIFGLGNFGIQGSTTHSSDDNLGYNWITMEFASTTSVLGTRAASGASANVSFQVVSFRFDQTDPPGGITDLEDPTGPFDNMYLNRKETGTVTLASGDNTVTAAISAVNMDSTFMLFSVRTSSNAIGACSVAGEITNSTTLTFARSTAGANDVVIDYQVFYFATGVYVQHGTTTIGSSDNQAISSVDTEKSFVLASFKNAGSQLGNDDAVVADLTSSTNIQFRAISGLGDDVAWQVVEMQDALVRKVSFTLPAGSTTETAQISGIDNVCDGVSGINGVDLDHTFMVSNHMISGDANSDDMARVQITDTNTIRATRVGTTTDLEFVAYVVELFDSSTVAHGNITISGTNTTASGAIAAVNEISSAVIGPSNMGRQGSSTFDTDDDLGYCWATYTLNSSTEIEVTRAGATSSTTVMPYQVLSFDNFRENPLPISLLSFEVSHYAEKTVLVEWATASELNNHYFTIERLNEDKQWEIIGKVNGAGNSSSTLDYKFVDAELSSGVHYYRLKQTDFDGKFKYFSPKSVRLKQTPANAIAYPNPTTGRIFLPGNLSKAELEIFDVRGARLTDRIDIQSSENGVLELNFSALENGIYLIKTAKGTQKIFKN